jgi:hypothetical protein
MSMSRMQEQEGSEGGGWRPSPGVVIDLNHREEEKSRQREIERDGDQQSNKTKEYERYVNAAVWLCGPTRDHIKQKTKAFPGHHGPEESARRNPISVRRVTGKARSQREVTQYLVSIN